MKKKILILIFIWLCCLIVPSYRSMATGKINIDIDGTKLVFDEEPFIENGVTMVPLRKLSERLNMKVDWNKSNQMVTTSNKVKVIQMIIGSKMVYVNNYASKLLQAPKLVNGRTFIPLRFMSESIGKKVIWDGNTKTIFITSMEPMNFPYPKVIDPILVPIKDSSINYNYPTWMDKKGVMYGYKPGTPSKIIKSTDFWSTWTTIGTIDTTKYGGVQTVMVTDSGRVIVGTLNGEVFVSDTTQTTFTIAFNFDGGYMSRLFGHNVYQNVLLIGSYAFKSDANYGHGPRQLYLSLDDGTTWKDILTRVAPVPSEQAHIHDVEYDPYSKRIWVVLGDNLNRQIMYSDDFGTKWDSVYPIPIDETSVPQFSQVIAYPGGVAFGTDSSISGIEGFYYWKRPSGILHPLVKPADIVPSFKFDSVKNLELFATRRWHIREKDMDLSLVPFVRNPSLSASEGVPRLMASMDGVKWFEIYRAEKTIGTTNYYGLINIIGPYPGDPQRRIFGIWQDNDTYSLFKAKLPNLK